MHRCRWIFKLMTYFNTTNNTSIRIYVMQMVVSQEKGQTFETPYGDALKINCQYEIVLIPEGYRLWTDDDQFMLSIEIWS